MKMSIIAGARLKFHENSPYYSRAQEGFPRNGDIKEFSALNQKELILFTSPIYDDNCKRNNEELGILLDSLDIAYYDFSDFFQKNNNMDYWKDGTHLSKEGAEIFSGFFYKSLNL